MKRKFPIIRFALLLILTSMYIYHIFNRSNDKSYKKSEPKEIREIYKAFPALSDRNIIMVDCPKRWTGLANDQIPASDFIRYVSSLNRPGYKSFMRNYFTNRLLLVEDKSFRVDSVTKKVETLYQDFEENGLK